MKTRTNFDTVRCRTKTSHTTEASAMNELVRMTEAHPDNVEGLHTFPCAVCGGWHLGRWRVGETLT